MNAQLLTSLRELHSRDTDGLQVRLLWSADEDRTFVAVLDARTGGSFHIEVRAGERAMDVFHHPFAYAAWRGIAVEAVPLPVGAAA